MASNKKMAQEFADILSDLGRDGSPSNVQFLKDGDHTIALVLPKGRTDIRQFYQRFDSSYKGEALVRYLIAGVITEADDDGMADESKVRYIKVTKTVLLQIVNLLSKRWDLFGADASLIVITKGKKGGKVSYSVAAIPEKFDRSNAQYPDQSIEEAANDQELRDAEIDSSKPVEDLPF